MTRYELLDRIGVGGMAEIFRGKAVAAGGFEKPVAIKRILPHLSQDRRFVELLIAEAKVLSLLKHRNIVQIFDVGLGDDGQYFLVMEYVDGKDMGAVQRGLESKRTRMPFDLCLHVGAEICEALEHAHTSRGPDGKPMALVHRDVSPSNVLLSRAGEIKLTDFGIAKRAESEATRGGAVRGKFAYIAPEQARNESLDPRSDVFSVGILLWELVCGRRLFSGLDDMAALRAVRDPQIPRPTEIDPRLPREIDDILLSALAKDKTKRIGSSGQLGQRLRSLRYSLAETSGDPPTELAKLIELTEQVDRHTSQKLKFDFDGGLGGESTVIRIHTADAFASNDDVSVAQARLAIDHFEEEQTRQATLTGDQLRMLRQGRSTAPPPVRAKNATTPPIDDDEMTRARAPIDPLDLDATALGDATAIGDIHALEAPPHQRLTPNDETRVVAPRDRRTPQAVPMAPMPQRPATQPGAQSSASQSGRPVGAQPGPQPGAAHAGRPPGAQPSASQTGRPPGAPPAAPRMGSSMGAPGHMGSSTGAPGTMGSHAPGPLGAPPHLGSQAPGPLGAPPHLGSQAPGPLGAPPHLGSQAPGPLGAPPHLGSQAPGPLGAPPQQGAPGPQGRRAHNPTYQPPPRFPGWVPPTTYESPHGGPPTLRPWVLIVGAIVMAAIAFAITRLAIG